MHTGGSPRPRMGRRPAPSQDPEQLPSCLRGAHCREENDKPIAPAWPVQLRVLCGSDGCPGLKLPRHSQHPPFPGGQTIGPGRVQGFCGNGWGGAILRSPAKQLTHMLTLTLTLTQSLRRSSRSSSLRASRHRMECVLTEPRAHLRHPARAAYPVLAAL